MKIDKPILQVALDFIKLDQAIETAKEAVCGNVDWIECGTPLIKSCGVRAIKILSNIFPDVPIVADMKTMDTGKIEASLAFSAGAKIVSVLGVADDKTIADAIDTAKSFDGLIMVDLINHHDPLRRAKEVSQIGADIILLHIGIDQQDRFKVPLDLVNKIKEIVNCRVAVAGGLTEETAKLAVLNGADIVIVGRYITRSKNICETTRRVKEAITEVKND